MKTVITVIFLMAVSVQTLPAQTFSELFQQDRTQKKYLLAQIAALQTYIGYVEKGYSVARDGMGAISGFKNGEFGLHRDYFSSLSAISPVARDYHRVAGLLAIQQNILQLFGRAKKAIAENKGLSATESGYVLDVWAALLDGCATGAGELLSLLTPGELKLKEDERLRRIDRLYDDMQEKEMFAGDFYGQLQLFLLQRQKEGLELERLKSLYGK